MQNKIADVKYRVHSDDGSFTNADTVDFDTQEEAFERLSYLNEFREKRGFKKITYNVYEHYSERVYEDGVIIYEIRRTKICKKNKKY